MPYGISVKCCNTTAVEIRNLWDEASIFEPSASMHKLGYPPHLTLAVLTEQPVDISMIMTAVFSTHETLSITFDAVKYFDNDPMVLWAKPRPDQALSHLHERLHGHLDPLTCHEHYRVGRWVPHCSLATKVPQSAKLAAIEWAKSQRRALTVEFDLADFVQFPPVVIHEEIRLL